MEALRETYPPLFRRHARRPRLTRMLDASTAQTILVTAPAGYGKTTLATEWVQGRDDVVWYRATSGSADVAAFSAGLADVMAPLVPGVGDRLKQRLRVADTPERAARPLAEILSEDLETWPPDALLIIDDYHLVVDSAPVEEFMDWLLMLTPALHVLVTARRRPKWASARRILYGEITEIDRGQLAMTTDEAALVLDGRSTEEVQALVQQAEGWPALIGLAALSATHELPTERVSEALYRYFAEEVVRGETSDVERFLLIASITAPIDLGAAEELLGEETTAGCLDPSSRRGLGGEDGLGLSPSSAPSIVPPAIASRGRSRPIRAESLRQPFRPQSLVGTGSRRLIWRLKLTNGTRWSRFSMDPLPSFSLQAIRNFSRAGWMSAARWELTTQRRFLPESNC